MRAWRRIDCFSVPATIATGTMPVSQKDRGLLERCRLIHAARSKKPGFGSPPPGRTRQDAAASTSFSGPRRPPCLAPRPAGHVRSQHRRSKRAVKRSLGASVIPRMRPDKSLRAQSLARRWGLTPAGAYGLAAIRYPDRAAIIDERGALTFAEVHSRTDALARALRASAIDDRDTVAIMCRNHRGFIEATVACSK